ncbi:putative C6 transcription factor [Hypoxylon sp. NC0597]|nr:putative C6 transcription factor [Hypoxylon sp. NC0597]
MDRRGPGHSAPYGQACMHCFKSKCKCVSRPDGDGCERCHRLNKQCRPSDSLRRRNAQKNQNSAVRIAQLEGRLEGLVSLLQSVTKSPGSSDSLRKVLDESLAGHGQPDTESQVATPVSISSNVTKLISAADTDNADSASPLTTRYLGVGNSLDIGSPYALSSGEAEAYLTTFRSQMLKYLAFIHIPQDVTAQQLHQTRPFLFRAIVAVASPFTHQKMARGKELKQILAQNALIENQSSLDLLLGLLTYIAWGWDSFLNKAGTLSRLIMLAMSIVGNLRLNKPLPQDVHMIGPLTPGFAGRKCEIEDPGQRHLERQRAVLGCFLLSSIISSYYAQMDAMRWTSQMEEGLRAIASNKSCSTDEAFSLQVRLQLLAQRTIRLREQQEANNPHVTITPLPTFVYLNALQRQLQDIRKSIPPGLEIQEILIAQVHYINLCINEAAHTANSDAPLLTTPGVDGSGDGSGFERLECLWRSATAIKSWLDIFFSLPPSQFRGLAFSFWVELARCVVVFCRLATLEDPAWDHKAVRNMVDLPFALDHIAEKMELASREFGERSSDDLFIQLSRLMRMFRARVVSKMTPADIGEKSTWTYSDATTSMGGNCIDENQNQSHMMQFFDFGNDTWWEEFSAGFR